MQIFSRFVMAAFCLLCTDASFAQSPPPPYSAPLVPLWQTWAAESTDHFYTISKAISDQSLAVGFDDQGQSVAAFLEKTPQANTVPFMRFYHPGYTDHFYATNQDEVNYILASGWQYEESEGYIYTWQVPGTVPLYRLSKTNPATQDHDHYYTLDGLERDFLVQYEGWTYDYVSGYVSGTAFPAINGGMVLGLRSGHENGSCYQAGQRVCTRSNFFGQYERASTPRQAGYKRQIVTFDFWSPNWAESEDHFGVMLRACINNTSTTCDGFYYTGVGMVLGNFRGCPGTTVGFENFWTGSETIVFGCGAPLQNNQSYKARVEVLDSGQASYRITSSTGQIVSSGSGSFAGQGGFHPEATGVLIANATTGGRDYTIYLSNIRTSWGRN